MSSPAASLVQLRPKAKTPRHEQVARSSLFVGLTPAELDAVASKCVEKRYEAGDNLFHEGDPCQGLHVLTRGTVKIFKTSASGREVMLAMIAAPSSVAEVPVFDGGAYPASAVATGDAHALFLDLRDFHAVCREHPGIALQALRVMGSRLRQLVATVERVSFGSIRQRLASMLLEAGSGVFTLPGTHQEVASRLGTVREVITRNLGRFQTEGLIEIRGREIHVLDRAGLEREAETEL